ncbi:MAG UNVERIFIED_CONTAM: hypothetical protein LVT10_07190 [Anaerolineae bacterium]
MIPGDKGILAPLEVTDYDLHPGMRDTEFIPNWSVEQIESDGRAWGQTSVVLQPQ